VLDVGCSFLEEYRAVRNRVEGWAVFTAHLAVVIARLDASAEFVSSHEHLDLAGYTGLQWCNLLDKKRETEQNLPAVVCQRSVLVLLN
jgi:hypothetical protein